MRNDASTLELSSLGFLYEERDDKESIYAVSTAHGFVEVSQPVEMRFRRGSGTAQAQQSSSSSSSTPPTGAIPTSSLSTPHTILKGTVHRLDMARDIAIIRFSKLKFNRRAAKFNLTLASAAIFADLEPNGEVDSASSELRFHDGIEKKVIHALSFGHSSSSFLRFVTCNERNFVPDTPIATLEFSGACVYGDSGSAVVSTDLKTCYGIVHGFSDASRAYRTVVVIPSWIFREVCPRVSVGTLVLQNMAQVHRPDVRQE